MALFQIFPHNIPELYTDVFAQQDFVSSAEERQQVTLDVLFRLADAKQTFLCVSCVVCTFEICLV
jgi:hypothetical protein